MNTMRLFVKILAVVKEQENSGEYNPLMFSQSAIGAPQREIDVAAKKLQNAGYISGLMAGKGIDNRDSSTIIWECSKPSITIAGVEYMETNGAFNKAKSELANALLETAKAGVKIAINKFIRE